ncbi:OmpA family protein [Shimia haliotis]|uniref:OmpA-OmpF porin, OOP family n=1 Tax=Shimia haliotis TaxID=1280847 RepID=A0A1I4FMR3_9RHOB|nr:OmpA family protein [Shimia haliotis]SFL18217.1 OmpA-OmpF porin, OOP family [Shimia haliotis]
MRAAVIGLALCAGLPVAAFEPELPDGAQMLANEAKEQRVYALPTGAFEAGGLPVDRVTGEVRRRSWRIASGFDSTASVASKLAAQLSEQDFDIVFSCDAEACGGFDFRFETEVLLPPDMFVDLSDFVFLSAMKPTDVGLEAVGVLVSRTAEAGMVQVIDVGPSEAVIRQRPQLRPASEAGAESVPVAPADLTAFEQAGYQTLRDLEFETGSSRLGAGPFASLQALAAFLKADGARRVALVGHTDAVGGLDVNTDLSRKRAAAVMLRLIEAHGVDAGQLDAHGVGFLAPVASNLTEAGRAANRRVEAVLLNTQ